MIPQLIAAPSVLPVSLADVKSHLRIDHGLDDSLLNVYLAAAINYVDGFSGILGRALCTQTWQERYSKWGDLRLELLPVSSIAQIAYMPESGAEVTVSAANYTLDSDEFGSFVRFAENYTFPALSPDPEPIRVQYVAGYGAAASVPPPIKAAIMILAGHFYHQTGAPTQSVLSDSIFRLIDLVLAPYKRAKF
jgi:uncharacterized phiE125 gp8 family phage protein